MIALEGIEKSFPTASGTLPVLKGIHLRVEPGELVAITGPSGSGKSTLLTILGVLDRPTAGRFLFEGVEVQNLSDDEESELRSRSIGFIFQAFHLIHSLTIEENVEVPLFYAGVTRGERRERAIEMLGRVGLGGRIGHYPFQLSGGEQQRVAIARSLIRDPRVLLADEPTGNLDSRNCQQILDIFDELHASGKTIIIITHDPHVAEHARRRVHLMDGMIKTDSKYETAPMGAETRR